MNLSDLRDLDFSNSGAWPWPIKLFAVLLIMAAVGGLGYYFKHKDMLVELEGVRAQERTLRVEFERKQAVMANLEAYRAQIEQLQGMLATMLQQLPTSTEMPDLLEDISNTGRTNGLAFELFRPEADQPRDFYAAKPISIKAQANYHQFGSFVSAIAALDRIVTLEAATMTDPRTGGSRGVPDDIEMQNPPLLIDARVQTYRYLENDGADALAQGGTKP